VLRLETSLVAESLEKADTCRFIEEDVEQRRRVC
jgi:hypothetical protein